MVTFSVGNLGVRLSSTIGWDMFIIQPLHETIYKCVPWDSKMFTFWTSNYS